VSSGSDGSNKKNAGARHLAVTESQIHNDWLDPLQNETRRRAAAASRLFLCREMAVRSESRHRLVTRPSTTSLSSGQLKGLCNVKDYNLFSGKVEQAFKDTDNL
jgi:hypothetical protein